MFSFDNFEVDAYTAADLAIKLARFDNPRDGGAELKKFCHYAMLFPDGVENKPVYYIRNCQPDGFRWASVLDFGNGPLEPQRAVHCGDMAQGDAVTTLFSKTNDSPVTYNISSEKPFADISFGEHEEHWVEGKNGEILDLKVEPFPYALFNHSNSMQAAPYWQQHVLVSGYYHGKPVKGMGGFDKTYAVTGREEETYRKTYTYVCALYSGIREDGRKESLYTLIPHENGVGYGFYYIDGEPPVISDRVTLEAEWHYMPYLPKEDKTVTFTNAVWRFGGKEFHFIPLWGSKGFTAEPNVAKYGQSQCFGRWYEGKTPYKHTLYHTFNESGDATDERIAGMGFTISR